MNVLSFGKEIAYVNFVFPGPASNHLMGLDIPCATHKVGTGITYLSRLSVKLQRAKLPFGPFQDTANRLKQIEKVYEH